MKHIWKNINFINETSSVKIFEHLKVSLKTTSYAQANESLPSLTCFPTWGESPKCEVVSKMFRNLVVNIFAPKVSFCDIFAVCVKIFQMAVCPLYFQVGQLCTS